MGPVAITREREREREKKKKKKKGFCHRREKRKIGVSSKTT